MAQNAPTLSNINMSPVKSEINYVVSELSYFKPSEDRKDVVTSLEEWAARILESDISIKIQRRGLIVRRSHLRFQSQNATIKI